MQLQEGCEKKVEGAILQGRKGLTMRLKFERSVDEPVVLSADQVAMLGLQEAPKQEAPKQEAPKQEAPKQEAPKQEAPQALQQEEEFSTEEEDEAVEREYTYPKNGEPILNLGVGRDFSRCPDYDMVRTIANMVSARLSGGYVMDEVEEGGKGKVVYKVKHPLVSAMTNCLVGPMHNMFGGADGKPSFAKDAMALGFVAFLIKLSGPDEETKDGK